MAAFLIEDRRCRPGGGDQMGQVLRRPGRAKAILSGAALILGIGILAVVLCGGPETPTRAAESRADAASRLAVGRDRRLGKLSRSHPPKVARPERGALVSVREMEPAFARYRDTLCERVAANSATVPDREAVLGLALSEAVPARRRLSGSLSEADVARRASPEVAKWLGDFDARGAEPCVVLALIQLLNIWPEAEPGDLLADLATHPPGGSLFITMKAIGAMGESGRADYVDVLATFVDPGNDSRVVAKATRAAAVITGDAELALALASNEEFPMDGSLAGELALALMPASGPGLDRTMQVLLGSDDPFRREAGLRAAAVGVGMPVALPQVLEATTDPDLPMEVARNGVDAILRGTGAGSGDRALLDLARNDGASVDARAAALLAMAEPPIEVAIEVAGRQPTPFMGIQLALRAERIRGGSARLILDALAAESVPKESLVEAIRAAENEALLRAGHEAFPDPGLWE